MRYHIYLPIFMFLLAINAYAIDFTKTNHSEVHESGKVWGIDISHHQNITSWNSLSDQKPHFIFMKATEGLTVKDSHYKERYRIAKKMGLTVGTYHFFSYRSSGRDQARAFLQAANYEKGDLPLVLDAEYKRRMPPPRLVTTELVRFLKYIQAHTGITPILYCSSHYYQKYLKDAVGTQYPLWIADYRTEPSVDYQFWQASEKFVLNGISGYVDLNVFNGTVQDLEKLIKTSK